jgi:nucleotide-binding universal stress UspA family protein
MPVNYFEEVEKVARESTQTFLDATVRKLEGREDDSIIISSEIIEGSPKRVILDEAERWNADLIVVGSHGYGILDRLLLGSVSQALALHAPCSVEIVRSRPENESGKVDG